MVKHGCAGPAGDVMRFTLALAVALLASGCGSQEAEKTPAAAAPSPEAAPVRPTPRGLIVAVFEEDAVELPPGDCRDIVIDIDKQRGNGAYDAFRDVNQAPGPQK